MRNLLVVCVPLVLCVLALGCGSGEGDGGPQCEAGFVMANPDGLGSRCIDADSDCTEPTVCATTQACCTGTCADAEGDRIFECQIDCRPPDCTSAADCDAAERCEVYTECSASCAPDLPCPDGQVMADPDGLGFRCVPAAGTCFRPQDCTQPTDTCCEATCAPDAAGNYYCLGHASDLECAPPSGAYGYGDGNGAAPDVAAYECYSDAHCVALHGEGSACDSCPGWCSGPAGCADASACVVATQWNDCCPCADGHLSLDVGRDPCLTLPGEDPPPGCLMDCDVECDECVAPSGVDCLSGACVGVP